MDRKKYYAVIFVVYLIYISILSFLGFFRIGFLSDDYNNLFDAVNSTLFQKFTGKLALTNVLHLRPIYYLSIQFSYFIHNSLGLSYDNFINFRVGNLILFILLSFITGKIIFHYTQNYYSSILGIVSIILFPSNVHNICWSAGRVDLLCGIFCLLYLYPTIKYLEKRKYLLLVLSSISLILALLTKETAIIALPVSLIFLYFFENKDVLKNNYKIFVIQFIVLLLYLLYKFSINQFAIQNFHIGNSSIVLIKSFLSLLVPVDFLTLLYQLKQNNLTILIYYSIFITFLFLYFIYLFQLKFFKTILFAVILLLISFIPYVIGGYVRPQLMIIPFSIITIFLISSCTTKKEEKKINFIKPLISLFLFVLLSWGYFSILSIQQWVYVSEKSKIVLNNLLNTDIKPHNQTIVLCNPGRLGQVFILDEINGAYNYQKYKQPVYKDTLTDIVLSGGMDKESIDSKLDYMKINDNTYEISSNNENQFFYIEGYDINKDHNIFENNFFKIEFSQFNYLKKPLHFSIEFKNNDIVCFIENETKYYKIY